jgi:hypothetical protein
VATLRSNRYRARPARYSITCAKPPHLGHSGPRLPQPCKSGLYRIPHASATVRRWLHAIPTDIEPVRLDIRSRAPNRPTSGIPAPEPPSPSTRAYTASRMPPPSLAGGYTQVPPISSPLGSMFGFASQTAPPSPYWALTLPLLRRTFLPQQIGPHHRLIVAPRTSH